MWAHLLPELLADIFSFLPPDSLALAACCCTSWRRVIRSTILIVQRCQHHYYPAWLLAMPSRAYHSPSSCFAYDPSTSRWRSLSLNFAGNQNHLRLVAPAAGSLLCKLSNSSYLRLALCNPFTRQLTFLPNLLVPRSNPAISVVVSGTNSSSFSIYVAGGSSTKGYEPTLEVFDSRTKNWEFSGPMPSEFAVRLTVWTPHESVHAGEEVFWMTSARAYSVVGYNLSTGAWREVRASMAEKLEWAALVKRRKNKLGLVGGEGIVWELREGTTGDEWEMVGVVPRQLGDKFARRTGGWNGTKCCGDEESVYLFRELGREMLIGREIIEEEEDGKQRWQWSLIDGFSCSSSCSSSFINVPIKGVLLHPATFSSSMNLC